VIRFSNTLKATEEWLDALKDKEKTTWVEGGKCITHSDHAEYQILKSDFHYIGVLHTSPTHYD
jgi:hypothetical protein